MKEYYIYEEEMDGSCYKKDIILADTKENALNIFFKQNNIEESAKWLYSATEKEKADKNKRLLEEIGYNSWDEYYEDMHPERPIEL